MNQAEAQRRWRQRHPERRAIEVRRDSARRAAQHRLAEAHPEEYERYLNEACVDRGIPRWGLS